MTDSDGRATVPIKLIDSERFTTMIFYAAAAADSRRLTRSANRIVRFKRVLG